MCCENLPAASGSGDILLRPLSTGAETDGPSNAGLLPDGNAMGCAVDEAAF